MTVGLSSTMAGWILNIYKNAAVSAITTVYAQLHTADPGVNGTATISIGSTTRNAVTFGTVTPSTGTMVLGSVSAWTNGGTTETLSHVSLWNAATTGTFLQSFALTSTQAWVSTNTFTLTTFTITYTPIAA